MIKLKRIGLTIFGILTPVLMVLGMGKPAFAEAGAIVSPMNQKIILVPGETSTSTFTVANPADASANLEYELDIQPFSADDKSSVNFVAKEDYSRIVDWISLSQTEGSLEPNGKDIITITINVPITAPAGGQYAAVIVKTKTNGEALINQVFAMSHLLYAEVAGETVRKGEISEINMPGFMFSGKIAANTSIKNLGNIHSEAVHILKVFPIIGDEEYYTNEEKPETTLIMPGATRNTTIAWDQTPSIGIFRVNYTVQYEGVNKELSKVVIICPIWLLFIIALIIALFIAKIFFRKKKEE